MRKVCLGYLGELATTATRSLVLEQFASAANMTDQFAALAVLAQDDGAEREHASAAFYAQWHAEALVVDKRLAVQAASRLPGTLGAVQKLLAHPGYDHRNPSKACSLLNTFAGNHVRFHAADGSGYRFLVEQIALLDSINPQAAARLARRFDRWGVSMPLARLMRRRPWKRCALPPAFPRTCAKSSREHLLDLARTRRYDRCVRGLLLVLWLQSSSCRWRLLATWRTLGRADSPPFAA